MDEKKQIRPQGRRKASAEKEDRRPEGKKSKKSDKSALLRSAEPEQGQADDNDREDLPSELDPILTSGALEMEMPLSGESIHAFKTYAVLLKEWNEKMNLTGIIDDSGIALRHFIDSLTLIPHLKRELQRTGKGSLTMIDVGTGAGFPGIPLKVVMPSLQITLLDSLAKRIKFLETVCDELKLDGVDAVHLRAEDAGRSKQHREKYDVATARAVAPLNVLCEYCLPLVRVGGIFLSMKGNIDAESQDAEKAVITLGGTIESEFHFTLPGSDMNRTIIVIRKIRPTPAKFPRKAGKPEKEPIV
ncbi:MAG: 16S rRNA (guanine(527)-N(7))-methyltransferase RsmG [Clostridiales bacterium]|nr:16S rRNA (guanine(527)-N(7))-methyltransferase RsmG [Clostridiales bacterium]